MPVSPEQDAAIDRMAHQFPPEGVRIQPNGGPNHDRAVILFPSGRQVVLDVDGEILGDSERGEEIVEALAEHTRRSDPSPPVGYDPACDLLIVERCDGQKCYVPPWRCAVTREDHATEYEATGRLLRDWAENVLHRPLKVWVLARGETEICEEGK